MKKTVTILIGVLLVLSYQNANAQTTEQWTTNGELIIPDVSGQSASNTTSTGAQSATVVYRITDKVNYTKIDFSKLDMKKDGDFYSVILPFTVTKTIPSGELFWLALYQPKDSKFNSWGIYNATDKFICRSFRSYSIGDESYILQAQDDLTEQIVQGKYTLMIAFKGKPTVNDIQVSLAYSTQKKFDEYAESLSQKQINSILPPNSTFDQWSEKADEYYNKQRYRMALISYLQAEKLSPETSPNNYNIGLCYYMLSEYDSAIKYFEKSLKLPDVDEDFLDTTYSCLGDSYYRKKNYQKAKEHYKRIISKTSHDYYWLGICQYNLGEYDREARSVFSKVEEDSELYKNAQYYLGLSLWSEGEKLIPTNKDLGFFRKGNALYFFEIAAGLGSQDAKKWFAEHNQSDKLAGTKWEKTASSRHIQFKTDGKGTWGDKSFTFIFDGQIGYMDVELFGTYVFRIEKNSLWLSKRANSSELYHKKN